MVDPSDAIQTMEDAIADVQARIATLESTPAQPVDLTALEARVATLEATPVDLVPLTQRIVALEAFDANLKIVALDDTFAANVGILVRDALVQALQNANVIQVP